MSEKYILDTNFFFNLEIKTGLGNNPKEIITSLTEWGKKLKNKNKALFVVPPRILDELYTFLSSDEAYVKDFVGVLSIKSPDTSLISFPANVFYQLVDETRDRSYRGLKIAEEIVDQAGKKMLETDASLSHIDYQKTIGEIVTKLRERYRRATRYNFLDSVADLDLIVLAKEINGYVVSSDEGVLRWGRTFGVREIPAQTLKTRLDALL